MELTQALFVKTIPYIYKSIRASSSKSIESIMKRNSVYRINNFDSCCGIFRAMTFKCVLFLLNLKARIKVFDSNSTFDRTQNITLLIWERFYASRLVFQA